MPLTRSKSFAPMACFPRLRTIPTTLEPQSKYQISFLTSARLAILSKEDPPLVATEPIDPAPPAYRHGGSRRAGNTYTPGTGALHGGRLTDCCTSPPLPGPSSPSGGSNHPHQRNHRFTRDSQRKDGDRHGRVRDCRRPLPQAVTSPSKTPCAR